MRIDVLTLFPEILEGILNSSILKRAQTKKSVEFVVHQLKNYAHDKHHTVDDYPFGGGPGMVMKCEPLVEALEAIQPMAEPKARVIHLTPQGPTFTQEMAERLAKEPRILFLSGHYEGVDERVREHFVDEELSIGDYVLTNGTLAAGVVIDAVVRLIPGVLGNEESSQYESFGKEGLLEGPQYTRPAEFRGWKVPEVLLNGNHAAIEEWRRAEALKRTKKVRKDLLRRNENEGE